VRSRRTQAAATSAYPGANSKTLGFPRFCFHQRWTGPPSAIRETLRDIGSRAVGGYFPLVLRQNSIWNGDLNRRASSILALERAFHAIANNKASEVVALEGAISTVKTKEARFFRCLEKLADHADALMEQLLEISPPRRARCGVDASAAPRMCAKED